MSTWARFVDFDAFNADVAFIKQAMSTVMMNPPPRRVLTPLAKRKERDATLDVPKPSTSTKLAKPSVHQAAKPMSPKVSEPASNNQLLAGYLAHEFLTKGTLMGQRWDPARAEAVPVSAGLKRMKQPSQKAMPEVQVVDKNREVADLFQRGGTHLPGIVNPTQLARFLQL